MNRGAERTLVPIGLRDPYTWPKPDESQISREDSFIYERRKIAVEMYLDGASYSHIKVATNKSSKEVRRLVTRCLCVYEGGTIYGFFALLPNTRTRTYQRKADIDPGKSGAAGKAV